MNAQLIDAGAWAAPLLFLAVHLIRGHDMNVLQAAILVALRTAFVLISAGCVCAILVGKAPGLSLPGWVLVALGWMMMGFLADAFKADRVELIQDSRHLMRM